MPLDKNFTIFQAQRREEVDESGGEDPKDIRTEKQEKLARAQESSKHIIALS